MKLFKSSHFSLEFNFCTAKWFVLHSLLIASYECLVFLTCHLLLRPNYGWFDYLVEEKFRKNSRIPQISISIFMFVIAIAASVIAFLWRAVNDSLLCTTKACNSRKHRTVCSKFATVFWIRSSRTFRCISLCSRLSSCLFCSLSRLNI
jgi:hypothetical protein